ncbi:MAG TPA: FHA domain-containing protein [Ktedonobacterales bacterium]|nr:FHA domain-containing protein [Ktedonobacterales bacterium]
MSVCSQCGAAIAPTDPSCRMCGWAVAEYAAPNGHGHEHAAGAPLFAAQANASDDGWLGAWVVPGGRLDLAPDANVFLEAAREEDAPLRRLIVRASEPDASGVTEREYVLNGRDVAIGRSPGCDISLPDDQLASRRHALLRFLDGHYSVIDLGSSNGTAVNGHDIREDTRIFAGDHIKVGTHDILVSSEPASVNAAVPASDPAGVHPLAAPNTSPEIPAIVPPSSVTTPPFLPKLDNHEWADLGESAASIEPVAAPQDFAASSSSARSRTDTGELESLHTRLNEISAVLAQRAEDDSRRAKQLQSRLREARSTLARALAAQPDPASVAPPERLGELIDVAGQAAENPYHLDYVTRLAGRSREIADALRALDAAAPYQTLLLTLRALLEDLNKHDL